MKTTLHSLDFGFLSSFFHEKLFFPKFELLNSGCCLSVSLYGIIIIMIIIIIIIIVMIIIMIIIIISSSSSSSSSSFFQIGKSFVQHISFLSILRQNSLKHILTISKIYSSLNLKAFVNKGFQSFEGLSF